MEQKQNSTGEGENLRCGVSTVGVRSGPMGWSQDPQHEDRPCMGPRVVALWDTAACPGHKGAVWGLCGVCVGAVWGLCGRRAPCLAVTCTICRRKRCLSQPTACTECRSGTGFLQHPTVLMGPAQGDTAVPMGGGGCGLGSPASVDWGWGRGMHPEPGHGMGRCVPITPQKGRAPHGPPGAQTGLSAADPHPTDPPGSRQGCPIG